MRRRLLGNRRGQAVNTIPNTFIGGVASTISTKTALASKLNILESDIGYFGVIGSNIEAAINTSYILPTGCFHGDTLITYYKDPNGLVNELAGINHFASTTNIKEIRFDSALSIGGNTTNGSNILIASFANATFLRSFYSGNRITKRLYIPRVTGINTTQGKDSDYNLFAVAIGSKIYANPYLSTSNNGGVEGDLQEAISSGRIAVYVQNFTKPLAITNLSHSAGTLNFTPPASTNTLDFYEVYKNGLYLQDISGSGATVSGLVTGDKVTVYACDIYYNRSKSNEITL